jgi:hypothetical protein
MTECELVIKEVNVNSLFEQGRPKYGRFEQAPQQININEFVYSSAFGRQITGLEKKLRYKQFQFISINNQDVMIGLAVADLAWAGHAFFYCYDKRSNQVIEHSFIQPLAYNTIINNQQKGETFFSKNNFIIHIRRLANKRKILVKQDKEILLDVVLDLKNQQPLVMCTPTGATGWTYTQKMTYINVRGKASIAGQFVDITDAGFKAALDETCGMLRMETAWHWLSLSGQSTNGSAVGINLATGVNETASTENSLWLNGALQELPPVLFEQTAEDEWRIYSLDKSVNLTAKTGWRRHESKNFFIVASQFSQWVSEISGTIQLCDESIEIQSQLGLVEQHFARW